MAFVEIMCDFPCIGITSILELLVIVKIQENTKNELYFIVVIASVIQFNMDSSYFYFLLSCVFKYLLNYILSLTK